MLQVIPTDGPLTRMIRDMMAKAEAESRHWDNLALFHFATVIADHYNLAAGDVLDEIETAPSTIIDNARNPQGLTAVAFYLASSLGVEDGPAYFPTIH